MRVSELTRRRWQNFRSLPRAYISLILLIISFLASLASPLWINDKPLIFSWKSEIYTPIFNYYPDEEFGGKFKTEANYRKLFENHKFLENVSWSIFPIIAHDPLEQNLTGEEPPPHAPSQSHLLGTDTHGRDVLARLIYGYRNGMSFSLLLTLITGTLAIVIGGVQGYLGGKVDFLTQRFIEVWSSLPFLYVVIAIGSFMGRGFTMLLIVMSIFSWIGLSYYMRGEFLKLKNQNYVLACRVAGISNRRIFFNHILPNALTPLVTFIPFAIIGGITSLTALDFLGFGLNPPTPSWGELLAIGLDNRFAPWISISTVMALFFALLLTAFVGEGVREAFDPKGGKN